jgi:hypothetical protein
MKTLSRTLAAATLATVLLTTGCAGTQGDPAVTPEAATPTETTATPAPAQPGTPTPTPPPATPETPAAAPAPTATPQPAKPATFTFPDGHLSFAYPASWKVTTEQGPYLTEESKAGSVEAAIINEAGSEVARIRSGMYGDGASGPVTRTVLERTVVPGIKDIDGSATELGFAVDQSPGGRPHYFMDVRRAAEFQPGYSSSGSNQVKLPNGIMTASVVFDHEKQPVFPSADAARAYMQGSEYQELKSLLLSLSYR